MNRAESVDGVPDRRTAAPRPAPDPVPGAYRHLLRGLSQLLRCRSCQNEPDRMPFVRSRAVVPWLPSTAEARVYRPSTRPRSTRCPCTSRRSPTPACAENFPHRVCGLLGQRRSTCAANKVWSPTPPWLGPRAVLRAGLPDSVESARCRRAARRPLVRTPRPCYRLMTRSTPGHQKGLRLRGLVSMSPAASCAA
jgi:hypothetical protein